MASRSNYKKTKYTGVYVKEDSKTKIKTYLARVKVKGMETEKVVGYSNDKHETNPSLAFQRRVELINEIKAGRSIKYADNPTLDKFFNEYMDLRAATLSKLRKRNILTWYNKWMPQILKNKKIKDITTNDIQKIVNAMIAKEHKPSYIENIKSYLSPVFNKAIELDIITKNPIKYLELPKYDPNKYFSLPEHKTKELYQEILNIADDQYRVMFLLLFRGRRTNEILSMKWEDFDIDKRTYLIRDKDNKPRKNQPYLLDDEILEHLNYLEIKNKGLIFISPVTGNKFYSIPKRLWNRIRTKLDIDMTMHDFRHLLGMTLVNNGIPLENIQRALGHSRITVTQRYSNQKEEMAKVAVDSYLKLIK